MKNYKCLKPYVHHTIWGEFLESSFQHKININKDDLKISGLWCQIMLSFVTKRGLKWNVSI